MSNNEVCLDTLRKMPSENMSVANANAGDKPGLDVKPCLIIAAASILANLALVANPGFYNHDEWQRYDFVEARGLGAAIEKYGALKEGATFAAPVRPIGLIQQAITAQWMKSAPLIPHLFDSLLHALVAVTLFKVLTISGIRRSTSVLASIIFCISPLTMLVTGWTAASYDQWYALFSLAGIGAAITIVQAGVTPWRLLALLLFSSAAMISKETAMVLPAAIFGCAFGINYLRAERVQWRRAIAAGGIAAIPVVVYMAIRFPALLRSLEMTSPSPYKPDVHNVVANVLSYIEFPFIPRLSEMISMGSIARPVIYLALLIHVLLVVAIGVGLNRKFVLAYVFAYGIFLLPVISISSQGAHYLYASGFALSLAVAWLLTMPKDTGAGKIAAIFGTLCLGVTVCHTCYIQWEIYRDGVCQNTFLTGLDAVMEHRGDADRPPIVIEWSMGTPIYIGDRSIFGRDRYKDISFQKQPLAGAAKADAVYMSAECRIR